MNFFTIKGHLLLTMATKCDKCLYSKAKPESVLFFCEDCILPYLPYILPYRQHCDGGCDKNKLPNLTITLQGAFCDACLTKQGA